jgi:hypothetical protein
MSIESFYSFGSTFSSQPVSIKNDKLNWERYCELVIGNYNNITLPIIFKQTSGKKWTDLLTPPSVSVCIISKKFYKILEENSVTGLRTFPVCIIDKQERDINDYIGISIIGKCGKIDYSKSEVYEKQYVPEGPMIKYYKGMRIGLDTWDGSDFFIPVGTLSIIVTERVKSLIKINKISNISLKNILDIEKPEYALPKTNKL